MGKITLEFDAEEYPEIKQDIKFGMFGLDAFSRLQEIHHELRGVLKYDLKTYRGQSFDDSHDLSELIQEHIYEGNLMEHYE